MEPGYTGKGFNGATEPVYYQQSAVEAWWLSLIQLWWLLRYGYTFAHLSYKACDCQIVTDLFRLDGPLTSRHYFDRHTLNFVIKSGVSCFLFRNRNRETWSNCFETNVSCRSLPTVCWVYLFGVATHLTGPLVWPTFISLYNKSISWQNMSDKYSILVNIRVKLDTLVMTTEKIQFVRNLD